MIDMRSDTVTVPTKEMYEAICNAPLGDDVFGDDVVTIELEKKAAERMKKGAALFVPTGSMGNLLAIMTHTTPGDEIIAGAYSHIARHELGSAARLCGVGFALADNPDTKIYPEDVKKLILRDDFFNPKTAVLCMENALFNGDIVSLEIMRENYRIAHEHNVSVHLDGARVFNAAVALGVDVSELAACTDSLMFCLSKGLCAPVGSLLCGSEEFIAKARKLRKMLGGGMRQVGVLAACGLISLDIMAERLEEDHANARYLVEKMAAIDGVEVWPEKVLINMVYWQPTVAGFSSDGFVEHMQTAGVKVLGVMDDGTYRFVTNNDVGRPDIDTVVAEVDRYIRSVR